GGALPFTLEAPGEVAGARLHRAPCAAVGPASADPAGVPGGVVAHQERGDVARPEPIVRRSGERRTPWTWCPRGSCRRARGRAGGGGQPSHFASKFLSICSPASELSRTYTSSPMVMELSVIASVSVPVRSLRLSSPAIVQVTWVPSSLVSPTLVTPGSS